jgi:hypothetical protein
MRKGLACEFGPLDSAAVTCDKAWLHQLRRRNFRNYLIEDRFHPCATSS